MAPLLVHTATWNVNGKLPKEPTLGALVEAAISADVIALGLQELIIFDHEKSTEEQRHNLELMATWNTKLAATLPDHVKLADHELAGMALFVYVRRDLLSKFSELQVGSDAVGGADDSEGNKGGCVCSVIYEGARLCFVSAHLEAHTSEWAERNEDVDNICKRTNITPKILDHAFIFFFGDFNYRVTLPREEVIALATAKKYDELLVHDQLKQQQAAGNVFAGFSEGHITHPPTFKYNSGTVDTFDTSKKQRVPAYTDRILWRGEGIQQLFLRSYMDYTISDHKPVVAIFRVTGLSAPAMVCADDEHREILRLQNILVEKLVLASLAAPGANRAAPVAVSAADGAGSAATAGATTANQASVADSNGVEQTSTLPEVAAAPAAPESSATATTAVTKAGAWLQKRGAVYTAQKRRYFVINGPELEYFGSLSPAGEPVEKKGGFKIFPTSAISRNEKRIFIRNPDRVWDLEAETVEIAVQWEAMMSAFVPPPAAPVEATA